MAKSFREDRDESSAAPNLHEPLDEKPRWFGGKRRHFPKHPRGQYAKLLDEMIEQARARRESNSDNVTITDTTKDEAYWRDRERFHAEQQKFNDAA
jgi:hypothetical protein